MQAYPVMLPWEIVSWLEDRMGRERLTDGHIFLLKFAWNDLGRRNWVELMSENELSKGIL